MHCAAALAICPRRTRQPRTLRVGILLGELERRLDSFLRFICKVVHYNSSVCDCGTALGPFLVLLSTRDECRHERFRIETLGISS